MKAPIITTLAGLAAMLAGYFAGAYFGDQREWIPMAIGYFVFVAGMGMAIYGVGWSIYEMLWGGRWKL